MTYKLRSFQEIVTESLRGGIRLGHRKQVLQASTGSGKTIMAVSMMQTAVTNGKKVLFIAHRKEIINQTSSKLDAFGIDHGVIMAGHIRYKPRNPVQVASIQTLSRRVKPDADLIFIDECHLSCSKSFTDLISAYPSAIIVGMTATPCRLDGKGLGIIYTNMVNAISMRDLIDQGHLVKYRVFAPFVPDLIDVKTVAGDYDQGATADLMDKTSITGDIVKHWIKHAAGRKTIVFAASVKHSEHIRDAFLATGVSAKHLDAKTNSNLRAKILAEWEAGKFDVLCNMGLFIEGLDVPAVSCCILARPTQSLTIYLQAVGRAMRTSPGKNDCIILDHAGLTYSHGLIDEDREWTLDGKKTNKKKDAMEKLPSVTICESCFSAFSRTKNPSTCPECGHGLPVKAVASVSADGELVELTQDHLYRLKMARKTELKQARTRDDLIKLGRSRGYKQPAMWADHMITDREEWRRKNVNN